MNLDRDFDVKMYQRADALAGLEQKLRYTDFSYLEPSSPNRPFLARVRQAWQTLTQLSKIRIQVTFEVREPALGKIE